VEISEIEGRILEQRVRSNQPIQRGHAIACDSAVENGTSKPVIRAGAIGRASARLWTVPLPRFVAQVRLPVEPARSLPLVV
jgi:hypothetical protein